MSVKGIPLRCFSCACRNLSLPCSRPSKICDGRRSRGRIEQTFDTSSAPPGILRESRSFDKWERRAFCAVGEVQAGQLMYALESAVNTVAPADIRSARTESERASFKLFNDNWQGA